MAHYSTGKQPINSLPNSPSERWQIAHMAAYLPRRSETLVDAALADTRVVYLSGARQVGKSTLVHRLVRGRTNTRERSLDLGIERAAAEHDPTAFVRHPGLLVIDEIQRVPELVFAIKAAVDRDDRPGQFLLTGSARLLKSRPLPDALVGRMETLELWPLSQGEIEQTSDDFVDRLFQAEPDFEVESTEPRELLCERLCRGGFPEAVRRDEGRRARFFAAYLSDLIQRDVAQLAEIERRDLLQRLLKATAARAAQLMKVTALASDLAAPKSTLERYLALFEEVFLIKRIPAWSAAATPRAAHISKLLFVDTGLCAHVLGRSVKRLAKDDAAIGPLLENFVLGELSRQLGWSSERVTLHHYRTRDGIEVDAVLEAADGRIVGVEIKAGETVRTDDFRSLRHLQARAGRHFHRGIVLHAGDQALSFGDGMMAVPLVSIWRVTPRRSAKR